MSHSFSRKTGFSSTSTTKFYTECGSNYRSIITSKYKEKCERDLDRKPAASCSTPSSSRSSIIRTVRRSSPLSVIATSSFPAPTSNSSRLELTHSRKFDEPPYSRCFILCSKKTTEYDLKKAFSKFGYIYDVWIVRDRVTGEPKGIVYIKFGKASEAAKAVEEMSGRFLNHRDKRPIKVFIAGCKSQIGPNNEIYDRMLRLFVRVGSGYKKADLYEAFKVRFNNLLLFN
jgi:RNA recognition motif-containing protein